MGTRRGRVHENEIASAHPSACARERQQVLISQLRVGVIEPTLTELQPHLALIREGVETFLLDYPLLRELVNELLEIHLESALTTAEAQGHWLADLVEDEGAWHVIQPQLRERLRASLPWELFSAAAWGEDGERQPSAQSLKARAQIQGKNLTLHLLSEYLAKDDKACMRLGSRKKRLPAVTWGLILREKTNSSFLAPPTAAERQWVKTLVKGEIGT
jgi:hypothetical protein